MNQQCPTKETTFIWTLQDVQWELFYKGSGTFYTISCKNYSCGSRISLRLGRPTYNLAKYFLKTALKWKKLDRGYASLVPPWIRHWFMHQCIKSISNIYCLESPFVAINNQKLNTYVTSWPEVLSCWIFYFVDVKLPEYCSLSSWEPVSQL